MEGSNGILNAKTQIPQKRRAPLDIPNIELPFPPKIKAMEIFNKSLQRKPNKSENGGRKAPNKFLIYRQVFVMELHRKNLHHSMTDVSGLIASRWKQEPKNVKDEYSKIAAEVDGLNKMHYGDACTKKRINRKISQAKPSPYINSMISLGRDIYGSTQNNQLHHMYHPYFPTQQIYQPPVYIPQQQNIYEEVDLFKQESYVEDFFMPTIPNNISVVGKV
ncbi:hypothetical protein C1645_765503 [Glomus cerebriforme]|uniref:HMG box domain-containing protein n=1 Tax=Glomus cerebriforme TaxID=658196 RepID=A0A397T7H8_9GLOM|nr:hypothetical protein C1645_765503 [Glomus cerebriforme]